MVFRAVAVVGCVSSLVDALPSPQNPPRFSFATIGDMSFAHAGKTTAYTEEDLRLLTRHSMVAFEKITFIENMKGTEMEDRMIAAAKEVKAYDPTVTTLFYMNGLLDFGFSRLHKATAAHPEKYLLRNSMNQSVTEKGRRFFDVSKPAMRRLFVKNAQYGMKSGVFDGVLIDRANYARTLHKHLRGHATWDLATVESLIPAQRTLLDDLHSALTDSRIIVAKESTVGSTKDPGDWQVANGAMLKDTFCSSYKPHHGKPRFDKKTCLEQIHYVQNVSHRPMLTQLHAVGPADDVAEREFTMACFLVAAGNLSFFSYVDWENTWRVEGIRWWPEYDKPVGEPNGPARQHGNRFTRSFASGTTVEVDLDKKTANISWASESLVLV